MFVDQGFGVAVKSPGFWRHAPSPHLVLVFPAPAIVYFHPQHPYYVGVEMSWY